ncbi:hypothetical protein [Actinocorallia libanotica]|uniref:Uncharacterized protein n=1 Tax=Actinocorallia libanotica TaxID=46162 RepID=A0ABP4BGJ6_9ACTN
MAKVGRYLVEKGGAPDGDHVKGLRDGVNELRLAMGDRSWRITFWKPGGPALLTVFAKTWLWGQAPPSRRMTGCPGRAMSTPWPGVNFRFLTFAPA